MWHWKAFTNLTILCHFMVAFSFLFVPFHFISFRFKDVLEQWAYHIAHCELTYENCLLTIFNNLYQHLALEEFSTIFSIQHFHTHLFQFHFSALNASDLVPEIERRIINEFKEHWYLWYYSLVRATNKEQMHLFLLAGELRIVRFSVVTRIRNLFKWKSKSKLKMVKEAKSWKWGKSKTYFVNLLKIPYDIDRIQLVAWFTTEFIALSWEIFHPAELK